jgi:hypothetical protein
LFTLCRANGTLKRHRRIYEIPSVDAITKLQLYTDVFVESPDTQNFCGQISRSQMKGSRQDNLMPAQGMEWLQMSVQQLWKGDYW